MLEGLNMKLGQGGIREIEFFTQTRQLICGRARPGSARARHGRWAARAGRQGLGAAVMWPRPDRHYRAHREVEHRLQMVHDAQTQTLPQPEGWDRLARFLGEGDTALLSRGPGRPDAGDVAALTEDFFAPADPAPMPRAERCTASISLTGWRAYPALRSARAQEIFARLEPEILPGCNPPPILTRRSSVRPVPRRAARRGAGFFAVRGQSHPDRSCWSISCATAPRLGLSGAQRGCVRCGDWRRVLCPWPGVGGAAADLTVHRLAGMDDYERKLDARPGLGAGMAFPHRACTICAG
jgi:[glutamine synthetase] adenylyltransferase / [glutamine synthetase]-adenylyl-L-tyrosine phosphorylase